VYDFKYTDLSLTTFSILRRSWTAINKVTEFELTKIGLTPDQLGIMWICMENHSGAMNLTEISRRLFRSKATITDSIQRMEKNGLIKKIPKSVGHSFVEIEMTAMGEGACRRGTEIIRNICTELMSAISLEQQEELQDISQALLHKALDHLGIEISSPPGFNPGEPIPVLMWQENKLESQ